MVSHLHKIIYTLDSYDLQYVKNFLQRNNEIIYYEVIKTLNLFFLKNLIQKKEEKKN